MIILTNNKCTHTIGDDDENVAVGLNGDDDVIFIFVDSGKVLQLYDDVYNKMMY